MIVKWKRPTIICTIVLSLVACSTHPQQRADPLADIPPQDELRFISADDATSMCIGDPKTPICAVETLLTCFARADIHLCQRLGITDVELSQSRKTEKYKIISAKVMTADDAKRGDLLQEPENPPEWWNSNTVEIIVSKPDGDDGQCHLTNCRFIGSPPSVGDECCYYTFITNPIGNEWHIISWWWWGEY